MLYGPFLGRKISHFKVNPVVRAFIIAEAFLWSAWDLIIPIFSVFVTNQVRGGNVQLAASGYSTYLITRVVFELFSGPYLAKKSDKKKVIATVIGMILLSVGYFGFSLITEVSHVFIFEAVLGAGLGIASPAKNSLFSTHLDDNKESAEWSLTDAVSFICMSLATALGGFIAAMYGFKVVFYLAAVINILGILPYFVFLRSRRQNY